MERAGRAVVDELFAAIPDEVVDAEPAFTLLFTKRCSLASYQWNLEPLPAAVERVRAVRAGTVVVLACETKA